jgi:hypothetical protein
MHEFLRWEQNRSQFQNPVITVTIITTVAFNTSNVSITEARSSQNAKMQNSCEKMYVLQYGHLTNPVSQDNLQLIKVLRYAISTMFPLRPLTIMTRVQKYAGVSAHNITHEANLSCNIAQFCNNLASCSLQAACSAYMKDRLMSHWNTFQNLRVKSHVTISKVRGSYNAAKLSVAP